MQGGASLLLLNCRSPFLDDSKVYCPLANLMLKSYVESALPNATIELGDDNYSLSNLTICEPFEFIGISVMTPQRHEAQMLARAIKQQWPGKTIIAGGPHVRYYCLELQGEDVFDYLVPFDGERALVTNTWWRGSYTGCGGCSEP